MMKKKHFKKFIDNSSLLPPKGEEYMPKGEEWKTAAQKVSSKGILR